MNDRAWRNEEFVTPALDFETLAGMVRGCAFHEWLGVELVSLDQTGIVIRMHEESALNSETKKEAVPAVVDLLSDATALSLASAPARFAAAIPPPTSVRNFRLDHLPTSDFGFASTDTPSDDFIANRASQLGFEHPSRKEEMEHSMAQRSGLTLNRPRNADGGLVTEMETNCI